MDIEIVSTEYIKPSCPTPQHLKTHKLSFLDEFNPQVPLPVLLFYSIDDEGNNINDITQKLKESLSEVLNHFYPLAGRIKDKFSVDCNDEGVYYVEAKTRHSLIGFFNQSSNFTSTIQSSTHKLLPSEANKERYVAMIQVTCFACGSIVIGASLSHKVADGATTSYFINSWASFYSSNKEHYEIPTFSAANYFPQYEKCPNVLTFSLQFLNKGRLAMRRFLFTAEAISQLKGKGSSLSVETPTRVEVVSSLICKCVASAFRANSNESNRPILVSQAMNIRRKASPTFPKSSMGNFVWPPTALMEQTDQLPELVVKFRKAVTNVDSEFVKSFQGEEGFVRFSQVFTHMVENASAVAALPNGANNIHFVSWCNFDLYDIDFGWGKPIWVKGIGMPPPSDTGDDWFLNLVQLMDTPSGNGIEAWIYLKKENMTILEQDKEFLAFASSNPNPLSM